jgi:hypothetical protein
VAATDGRLVAVGDQQGGGLSFHLWTLPSSLRPAGAEEAPPWLREDCARRLREFFGYQMHYLWNLGRGLGPPSPAALKGG